MLTGELRTVFGWTVQRRAGREPDEPAELPDAGERGGDDAAGRVPGDRARDRGVLPGPRRLPDRGARPTRIEAETERMQAAMREASELVLPGFPLRTDAKVVRYPDRYTDPRGERMWNADGADPGRTRRLRHRPLRGQKFNLLHPAWDRSCWGVPRHSSDRRGSNMVRLMLCGVVSGLACVRRPARADDAEDKAVAFVEKLGGEVTRDEKLPGKPVITSVPERLRR